MKVLFANAPWWINHVDGDRAGIRAGSRWPFSMRSVSTPNNPAPGEYLCFPHFLAYAASYVAKHVPGAAVHLRDSIATREGYFEFYWHCAQEKYDYIVMESATSAWGHDSLAILRINAHCPRTKIIVTGPVTVSRGEEILRKLPVHACVRGEYEKGVVRVLNGEKGLIDFDLLTVDEMNSAPIPMFAPGTWDRYWDACPQGNLHPQLQAWSSRSCQHRCVFCAWPAAMTSNDPDGTKVRKPRFYTLGYMRDYLKEMTHRHPFRSVYFDDDFMNNGDKHTLEMCEVMREVNLPWSAMCRLDSVAPSTWKEMARSGCTGIKGGFESGDQWVLDNIVNKRLDLGEAVGTLELLKTLGINVHTTWTIGLPGETKEQQQRTLAMIQDLYRRGLMASHQLSGTATIDGTPMANLVQLGTLPKYPGARAELNGDSDGQRKVERMMEGVG